MRLDGAFVFVPKAFTLSTAFHAIGIGLNGIIRLKRTPNNLKQRSRIEPYSRFLTLAVTFWIAFGLLVYRMCAILAQRHGLGRFVEPQQFSKLQNKCRQSFH